MHFLDVGQGDCTIIQCDGETMLVDGGTPERSSTVYSYLDELGVDRLKYVVATHPDRDHIGGIPAAFQLATVDVLLTPVLENETECFKTLKEQSEKHRIPMKIPSVGDILPLGGATITVLSPAKEYANDNNMSIVLYLTYGGTSVLLFGDAENTVQKDLLASGINLDADVLKVAHHGSKDATSVEFVEAVSPICAVISHGDRYSHPEEEAMKALLNANVTVYTTYQIGNIRIRSDGTSFSVLADAPYVGNRNSHKFHQATCPSVVKMKETNKVLLYTREEAVSKGYDPCNNCAP